MAAGPFMCTLLGINMPKHLTSTIFYIWAITLWTKTLASQRSLHNAPIFRLLLKVAVNGTHQCDFQNFCGGLGSQHPRALASIIMSPLTSYHIIPSSCLTITSSHHLSCYHRVIQSCYPSHLIIRKEVACTNAKNSMHSSHGAYKNE